MPRSLTDNRTLIVVPVYRPAIAQWLEWIAAICNQSVHYSVLVIDSGSPEAILEPARAADFSVHEISKAEFNHGGTRQLAVDLNPDFDFYVFFTQDAIPTGGDAIRGLLDAFHRENVGAAYGRQLPRIGAGPIEAHARLFNYPQESHVCSFADAEHLGIKAAFNSNSFAAYRREALVAVGGFPSGVILGEDTVVAAKMLKAGWQVAYQAEAQVYHSHDYNYLQEFRRYFDIGVLHARESWMLDSFGAPEGEGGRFVRSEIGYLLKTAPWLIPSAFLRTLLKYGGYRLGRLEHHLPVCLKRHLSMHRRFWRSLSDS